MAKIKFYFQISQIFIISNFVTSYFDILIYIIYFDISYFYDYAAMENYTYNLKY